MPDSAIAPATGGAARTSEAVLAVEGIHCASCVQLIEMRVGESAGVESVDVGLISHRARVRWRDGGVCLADITAAIARAGYRAWPVSAALASIERSRERRMALWRLFVAGFSMMQVMMYATPAYLAGVGDMAPDIEQLLRIASLVLTVPVMAYAATPILAGAWRNLAQRRIGMDVPAALGLLVTFGASAWATVLPMIDAGAAVDELARMQPARALLLPDWPRSQAGREVDAASLAPGDLVLVRAGCAAPADGVVVDGVSLNDEALISGESRPVAKAPGAAVTGGAINLGAPLVVRVSAAAKDSQIAHLVRLVESAADAKPWLNLVVDRHAATFLWTILALAAATALGWALIDPARAPPETSIMQSIQQRKKPITPWYREPWPWLLMSGPATVVVAGIYTSVLAFSGTDGLVADDYYKQGLAMNKTLGRGLRAQQLDLAARVNYTAASGQVRVVLTGAQHPPALLLSLTHPTRVGMDQRIDLKHLQNGEYEAVVILPTGVNRWNAVLETPEWRLAGAWADPARAALTLAPARS